MSNIGQKLYSGEVSIDFVGRRKTWYVVSGIILIVAIGALVFRGLNLGIEFRGGADFAVPNATCTVEQARDAAEGVTGSQSIVTETGSNTLRVQTEPVTPAESTQITAVLAQTCGANQNDIKVQLVGPTWGSEITKKALQGLVVFLILVTIFLSIYFEWRMALAALVALVHDLVITIGIYALTGLEVTPATVIGLLTILGFSLYDTVVVFDKVKENTRNIAGQSMMTYDDAANLAVNQTLVRSINTSIVALLPVLAIIVIGAFWLGAGTLLDLAVALGVGMAAGAYSSIFIATPFLAQLKSRQPQMRALSARVAGRRASGRGLTTEGIAEQVERDDAAPATMTQVGPRSQPKKAPRSKRRKS